jgi:hypothetical protein
MDWQPIDKAPLDFDLEVSVIEAGKAHALVFPCRRATTGWRNALTHESVSVRPTHWRYWEGSKWTSNGKGVGARDPALRRTISGA